MAPSRRFLSGALALSLGLAACSGDGSAPPADSPPGSATLLPAGPAQPSQPSHLPGVWGPLRDAFWRHAGRLDDLPPAPARVRVAVLDTAALPYDAPDGADRDGHGRLVGRAIGDLACPAQFGPGSGCLAEIVNYLALPRLGHASSDAERGGSLGTRADLAGAVDRALDDWQRDRDGAGGPARLVLNLSVAWAGEPGAASPSDPTALSPESAGVQAALRRASCAGALVVAAAGNAVAPATSGPALPAAWEAEAAPSDAECARDGFALAGARDGALAYRPLVHAVAALDQFDRPLATTRPGGLPRLAAYGLAVVTHDPRAAGGVTPVASGTSLGAAVASAAAAVAWAYRPELGADGVMQLVYEAGAPLSGADDAALSAEACLGAPCGALPVRRASVCAAARSALCAGPGPCDAAPACEATPGAGRLAAVDTSPFGALTIEAQRAIGCADGDCSLQGLAPPEESLWVAPQPAGGGCDTCAIDPAANALLVSVDPAQRTCLLSLELALVTTSGVVRYSVPRPNPDDPFYPLAFSVPLPDDHIASRATSATLWSVVHGTDGANHTYSSAIPLLL